MSIKDLVFLFKDEFFEEVQAAIYRLPFFHSKGKYSKMSKKQYRIIQLLISYALESNLHYKHAACLVRGGKIIKIGINSPFIHAEEKILKYKNKGVTLYVIRIIVSDGEIVLKESKPCRDCSKLINDYGIKKVVYSTTDGIMLEKGKLFNNEHISSSRRLV